jgi:hypothetical protein
MNLKKVIAALIILILLLAGGLAICYNLWQKDKANYKGIVALDKKLMDDTCKYIKARDGKIISLQKAVDVTTTDLKNTKDSLTLVINDMKLKAKNLKYIDQVTSSFSLKPKDSIVMMHDTITKEHPEAKWSDSTQWYQVRGLSTINKTVITYLHIPTTLYLAQGTDGKTYAMNTNPNIVATNILAVNVTKPKKWFQRDLVKVGVVVVATLFARHEALVYLK